MKYTEKVIKNKTFKVKEYTSIIDFTNDTASNPGLYNKHFSPSRLSSNSTGSYFSGTQSYDEALNLLKKGWLPEAQKITKQLKSNAHQNTLSSTPTYSVVGHQPSVARYLQGIPTNMITRKPQTKAQKIITLNRSMAYNCNWSTEAIQEQGLKTLGIIQGLEAQGYRVKLNMVAVMVNSNEVAVCKIVIKKPEEHLQLSKVAFPLSHPSMLRRLLFRWIEKFVELQSDYSRSYGRAEDSYLNDILAKGEYLIPALVPDNYIDTIAPQK